MCLLPGLGDRYPRQLSGGQRQRVALARALASNPNLLLLDEPFGALDAVVRKQLRSGLKEIVRSVGVTTIIVTHDQEEAFDLADKVVIFNRGLVEQQGPPTEIIAAPATPFVMKFVGDTNVVPANCLLVRRSRYATSKARVMFRPTGGQWWLQNVQNVHTCCRKTDACMAHGTCTCVLCGLCRQEVQACWCCLLAGQRPQVAGAQPSHRMLFCPMPA